MPNAHVDLEISLARPLKEAQGGKVVKGGRQFTYIIIHSQIFFISGGHYDDH